MEAETVATSDNAGLAIWSNHFLQEQGYIMQPAIIEQDNQGAMSALKKGMPLSDRSKHINIRYFWLSDRIKIMQY